MNGIEVVAWNLMLTVGLGILAYLVKDKVDAIKELSQLLAKTREDIARDHVTRAEVRADFAELKKQLDNLNIKLDRLMETRNAQ